MLLLMLQGRFRRESTSEGLKTLKYCSLANPLWGCKQRDWAARKSTHFNVAIRCFAFVFPLPARLHHSPSFSPLWTKNNIKMIPFSFFCIWCFISWKRFRSCCISQFPLSPRSNRTQLALFSSIYSITKTKIFQDSRKYYAAMRKNTSREVTMLQSSFPASFVHSLLWICRVGRNALFVRCKALLVSYGG